MPNVVRMYFTTVVTVLLGYSGCQCASTITAHHRSAIILGPTNGLSWLRCIKQLSVVVQLALTEWCWDNVFMCGLPRLSAAYALIPRVCVPASDAVVASREHAVFV